MAGSPQHVTLTANTVATVSFDADYSHCEVANTTGTAVVYFRTDGTDPAVAGTGSHMVPAVAGAGLERDVNTTGSTVIKLISAGTPTVSVTCY